MTSKGKTELLIPGGSARKKSVVVNFPAKAFTRAKPRIQTKFV